MEDSLVHRSSMTARSEQISTPHSLPNLMEQLGEHNSRAVPVDGILVGAVRRQTRRRQAHPPFLRLDCPCCVDPRRGTVSSVVDLEVRHMFWGQKYVIASHSSGKAIRLLPFASNKQDQRNNLVHTSTLPSVTSIVGSLSAQTDSPGRMASTIMQRLVRKTIGVRGMKTAARAWDR